MDKSEPIANGAATRPLELSLPPGDARLELMVGVLIETPWLDNLEQHAKPARIKLLNALGLPPPVVADTKQSVPLEESGDDHYEDLQDFLILLRSRRTTQSQ